ncbi:MAG: 30S ribosomal protein S3 [Patescibacteria group bacterium]
MTHTVHPYSHRLGIIRDWQSRWFGRGREYTEFLRTDVAVREHLAKVLRTFHVQKVEIERGAGIYRIIVKTSRPGMIIGRSGEGSAKIRADLLKLLAKIKAPITKDVKLDIEEVKQPETHAAIAAHMIVETLEKRLPYKRAIKQTAEKVMANRGVGGVKIVISGRLGGNEIARVETIKKGRLPLQTFKADIDFAKREALLSYGVIGVKVWIFRLPQN